MKNSELDQEVLEQLVDAAQAVRMQAYAPYSNFLVGAAILSDGGQVFVGCNVENASYGLAICAERSAVTQMIAQGEKTIRAVAVVAVGGVSPCGACRQVLREFAKDCPVIAVDSETGKRTLWRLSELLPGAFDRDALRK